MFFRLLSIWTVKPYPMISFLRIWADHINLDTLEFMLLLFVQLRWGDVLMSSLFPVSGFLSFHHSVASLSHLCIKMRQDCSWLLILTQIPLWQSNAIKKVLLWTKKQQQQKKRIILLSNPVVWCSLSGFLFFFPEPPKHYLLLLL